jgi:hypothetical protein
MLGVRICSGCGNVIPVLRFDPILECTPIDFISFISLNALAIQVMNEIGMTFPNKVQKPHFYNNYVLN